jgi:hypothetical protein
MVHPHNIIVLPSPSPPPTPRFKFFSTFVYAIWKQLYNTSSVADFGTLMQLRNVVNRRNVVKVTG